MAWFGAPLLFGQAGDAGTPALEDGGSDGWWAGTMRAAVPVALSLALAANATAAHAQRVAAQPQDELAVPQYANQTPTPLTLYVADPSVAMPVPWYWHQDELYVPPLRGEDDPPPSPAPAPWRYQALDPWGYDQPDRLPVLDEDGYAPPVVAGWPWQQGITGGGLPRIDGPAAPSLSVDEGTWPVPVVVPWAALTYQPGDQDEYPTPPPPVLPGEDEPYLPSAVVPWAVASYLPLDQGEHALLHAEDDPYLPPGMPLVLPIGLPAWLGADEEILPVAAGLAGDEGAVLFGVQVGGWELVPPPAGGFGPPYVAAGLGIEEEPHLYWLVPQPPFSDPAFFVYEGEELAQPLDEDGYQPGVPVWGWQKPVFAVWALDEYPSGATPSIFGSDDAFQPPAPRAGWLAAPLALWAPDEVVPTLGVEHDPYVVPLPPLARPVGMPLGLGADDVAPVQPFGLHDDPDLRALFPLAPWYATVLPLGYDQGDGKPTATTHALASVLNWTDAVLSGYIHAVPVVLPRPPKGRGGKFGPLVAPPARVFYSAKAEREWRRAVEQKVFELRQQAGPGTAHEATDYALSSGWGATGSVSAVAATDVGGRVTIACAGAGVGANPTVTLTFRDGAFQVAPAVSCSRGDANAPTTAYWSTTTPGTSTVLFTFVGTPVAGTSYILDFTVVSRDPA